MLYFKHFADDLITVKFDTDNLPAILNALETENQGNKLVLEVAVSGGKHHTMER